jgi:hypothetical protein
LPAPRAGDTPTRGPGRAWRVERMHGRLWADTNRARVEREARRVDSRAPALYGSLASDLSSVSLCICMCGTGHTRDTQHVYKRCN